MVKCSLIRKIHIMDTEAQLLQLNSKYQQTTVKTEADGEYFDCKANTDNDFQMQTTSSIKIETDTDAFENKHTLTTEQLILKEDRENLDETLRFECDSDTFKADVESELKHVIDSPEQYCTQEQVLYEDIRNGIYHTNSQPCQENQHSEHNLEKPFKCDQCDFRTASKKYLSKHKIVHLVEKRFKCSVCSFGTNYKRRMNEHMTNQHAIKSLKCDQCNFTTSTKDNLRRHKMSHLPEKRFTCAVCSYGTNFLNRLNDHVTMHNRIKTLKCDQCGFSTAAKGNLRRHKIRHHTEKPFKCEICDYSGKTAARLKIHKNNYCNVPHGGKKFECDLCSYVCRSEHNLVRHKSKHSEGLENPFEVRKRSAYRCDKCSFADQDINLLVAHMKTHFK